MQRKRGLRERLVSLLELPGDVVLDVARITWIGDVELVVENHRGLTEYRPDQVVLRTATGQLVIDGEEMQIGLLSSDQVILLGRIRGLRYAPPAEGEG